MRSINLILLNLLILLIPITVLAGSLDDTGAPSSSASTMYTLEDIYNRLNSNTQATKRSGAFTEPSAAPGSTGHTLDQVYEKAIPTQVPKTGQTTSYLTGDDGDLEEGVAWPGTRLTDNLDGTITDNLTGLVWLKNANCTDTVGGVVKSGVDAGQLIWANALTWCNNLAHGDCSLTDSSSEGQWRLPNRFELESLLDLSKNNPAIPTGFTNVVTSAAAYYWSSSTNAGDTDNAWDVRLKDGYVFHASKGNDYYVLPVRGGQ